MQGLSYMDYTPELLQVLYSVAAKSRQGGLGANVKVLRYIVGS